MNRSLQPTVEFSADRQALLALLQQEEGLAIDFPARIPRRQETGAVPLSFAQKRLWFLDQLEPASATYNIFFATRLRGGLDIPVVEQCLNAIVQRHEALRTTFAAHAGEPYQIVNAYHPFALPVMDVSQLPERQRTAEIQRLLRTEAQRPFDLSHDLLLRAALISVAQAEHILLLTMHHIASDGWSFDVFFREFITLYSAFRDGDCSPLPELPIQYADYAVWQQSELTAGTFADQLAYWQRQLGGERAILELPTDHPRPPVQTFHGAQQVSQLAPELAQAIKTFAQQEGTTLFMTLLAAFKVLLYRYSGQEDVIIGSPIANRDRPELEPLIGFFLNTLVLRTNLAGEPTFRSLLARVRQVCLAAYDNQDVPFEKILEEVQPERDLSRTPLFQVFFNMLTINRSFAEPDGITTERIPYPDIEAKFDMTLYVEERDAQIELTLVYNTDLFSAARMAELLAQYTDLLVQLVIYPDQPITSYSLVTAAAATALPDPVLPLSQAWQGSVPAALARQAAQQPAQVAVADAQESWTYAELEQCSNQLAHALLAGGVQAQDVVAIYGHRSAALVWAVMGILKAGGAFLILDPAYPAARLVDYLELAQPRAFLEMAAAGPLLPEVAHQLAAHPPRCRITIPRHTAAGKQQVLAPYPTTPPPVIIAPDDLAYISFTSGSTGQPKGILGRHGSLTHFLPWQTAEFQLSAQDRFSMLSGLAHDPLHRDIFTALWVGGRICVPEPDAIGKPGWLSQWLAQAGVTIAHLTPAMGQLIAEAVTYGNGADQCIPSLRYAFFVGDILTHRDVDRLNRLAPNLQVVNYYGSTETQRAVSYFVVPRHQRIGAAGTQPAPQAPAKEIIPLGRGMPDVQLLVVNQRGELAGIGEVGEIYMRSPHLALGYLNSPQQTQEKFLPNPFTQDPHDRVYRTGDLGRYLPDGNVTFAGRADQQVKLRGFRIELGEIEAVLGHHPAIREAVVLLRQDKGVEAPYLAAYVVLIPEQPVPTVAELRAYLQERLPTYMVPPAFVFLDALPLTPNRKIDRRALPVPAERVEGESANLMPPQNEIEARLIAIWQELLGKREIGTESDFFALGGHSLLAVRLFARIEAEFGTNLPLNTLFREATIRHLATALRRQSGRTTWSSLVEIQPPGEHANPPFFCVHGITGDIFWFEELARLMGACQPFYGLQSQGLDGLQQPLATIEAMAAHYIEEIRSFQPQGPYYLGGYSYGANVAFEMARQLQAQGDEIGLLVILDQAPAKSDYFRPPLSIGVLIHLLKNLPYRAQDFLALRPDEMTARIAKKLRVISKRWRAATATSDAPPQVFEAADLIDRADELPIQVRQVIEANYEALQRYQPSPAPLPVTLLRAKGGRLFCAPDPQMGWGALTNTVTVKIIPGSHLRIFKEPHVTVLAQTLQCCIDEALNKQ